MKITYEWRELTNDGLLKEPKPVGPYYDEFELNIHAFDSREDAIDRLKQYIKEGNGSSNLVLMEIFN